MSETVTDEAQHSPPRPDTPQGHAQMWICALDMAIRCRDQQEGASTTVSRAYKFALFLGCDVP